MYFPSNRLTIWCKERESQGLPVRMAVEPACVYCVGVCIWNQKQNILTASKLLRNIRQQLRTNDEK